MKKIYSAVCIMLLSCMALMAQSPSQQITAMEYYFDTDPGEGNGTSLSVAPGTSVTINPLIPLPSLAPGFHQLYIRAKDQDNRWSIAERRGFFVITQTISQNITALQYYFDTDPGEGIAGNGAIVPIPPNTSVVTNAIYNVPTGLGCTPALYVRYKDSNGNWSISERRTFDNPHTVPYAEFTSQRTGNTFFFESDIANNQTHSWNYGDLSGLETVAVNPSHSYSIPNDYNVCLTASNPSCGSRTTCHTVTFPGLAGFSPSRHAPVAGFVGDVSGGGFITGTTFKFIGVGADIVPATTLLGGTARARLFCDLTGQPAGMRHLVVTIPGQPKDTLFDALDILSTYTASAGVRPRIAISGPEALWSGTEPEEFVVSITNNTDETMYGVPVFIEIPPVEEKFLSTIIPDGSVWSTPQNIFIDKVDTNTNTVTRKGAFLVIPYLSPGSTEEMRFELSNPNPLTSTIQAVAFPPVYANTNIPGSPTFICNIPSLFNSWFSQLPAPPRYPTPPYGPSCWMDWYIDILPNFPWGSGGDDGNGLANGGGAHLDDATGLGFTTPEAFADFWNLPLIAYGDDKDGGGYGPGDWTDIVNPCPGCIGDIIEKILDIITSIDPNCKSGVGNTTADNYVNGLSPLTYQVHFENLSSATAPASFVTITDNIDTAMFDMSTFMYKSFGFAGFKRKPNIQETAFVNDVNMNPVKDVVVRNMGNLNPVTGLLDWKMLTYYDDTLDVVDNPLLGFLDPNNTAPEGEGYIEFSLMPKQSLTTGTTIANEASITFDFNAPIITNTWINKIDKQKPASNVAPLPATTNDSVINIIVTRTDAHAGILDYELYLKENSGLWKVRRYLTADTIKFAGTHGSTYQFYSVARDRVLNIEDAPLTPDATTTLDTTRTVYYADVDGDGFGNPLAPVLAYVIPAGFVTNNTDCNDTLNTTYPGAPEVTCNGIDENCNGMADDGVSSTAATSATTDAANDEICAGASVNLTVNGGTLGTGAVWNWYSGLCNGTLAGTGTSISVSPSTTTTYFVKATGLCNTTLCVQVTLTVKTTPPSTSVVMPIANLPAYGCNGVTISNISVAAVTGATQYIWDAPTGTVFNGVGNPYTSSSPNVNVTFGSPNGSGYHIGVQAANSCGTSARKSQWVRGIVSVPSSVNPPTAGLLTYCANTGPYTFSCPAVTGATQYLWTVTGDATVSGTGTTATVNFGPLWTGGVVSVAAQTTCYTSAAKSITLSTAANPLGTLSGVFTACTGATQTYSVPSVQGAASYSWTLPATATGSSTSNSINVTFGAGFTTSNICVQTTSLCGVVSAPKCKTIVSGAPARPASIAGALSGLCGQTVVYSCPPMAGVSYNWTLPSGATGSSTSNAISVTYPSASFNFGALSVSAVNSCGESAIRSITVKGAPNTPGSISATPSTWCANDAGITFNSSLAGMTGVYLLHWQVVPPAAANYVAGQGTSSYTADWNSGNASVSITASNACGSSTRSYAAALGCRASSGNSVNEQVYGVNVFPVPASHQVELGLILETAQTVSLVLHDNVGRVVLKRDVKCIEGHNSHMLDVSNMASGSYILNIETAATLLRKKLIVERSLTK